MCWSTPAPPSSHPAVVGLCASGAGLWPVFQTGVLLRVGPRGTTARAASCPSSLHEAGGGRGPGPSAPLGDSPACHSCLHGAELCTRCPLPKAARKSCSAGTASPRSGGGTSAVSAPPAARGRGVYSSGIGSEASPARISISTRSGEQQPRLAWALASSALSGRGGRWAQGHL